LWDLEFFATYWTFNMGPFLSTNTGPVFLVTLFKKFQKMTNFSKINEDMHDQIIRKSRRGLGAQRLCQV